MTPALKQKTEAQQVAAVVGASAATKTIVALKNVPKFNNNGVVFEFEKGEKATIPAQVADSLIRSGKVVEVSESEEDETQDVPANTAAPEPAKKTEKKETTKPADPTYGLGKTNGILVTGKANTLSDIIRKMCVPSGKEALVNPLPLRIQNGKLETQANSRFKGLAVFGAFPIEHRGDGEICLDPIEFRSFLDLYGDQHVAILFSPDGRITIQGERRSSTLYTLAEETPPFYVPSVEERDDGHVTFTKQGKTTEWVAVLKAKELSDASSPSNLLGVKTWTLLCDTDGLVVSIGSVEGKGRTVQTRVPANFSRGESKKCGSEFGEDFGTLMNILDGDIELATGGDVPDGRRKMPAFIRCGNLTYVVMARKDQVSE